MATPKFREKDLVWAKMRGYPAWPARVTKPPRGQKGPKNKHYVFFYGTHEYAWIAPADLFPYQEHRERFKKNTVKKGFVEAVWEIEEDSSLKISSATLPARKGHGKKRQRSPQQESPESPSDHRQQTGGTPGASPSCSDAPPTKKGRGKGTEESATPSGDSQEPLVSQKDTQKQSQTDPSLPHQDPSSPLPEARVTQRGMTMRNRQVLSSPQYYARALSPCKVTAGPLTGAPSEGTGPGVQDQTGVVGSSTDIRDGNETSSIRDSHDVGNRNETTSSPPPESSDGCGTAKGKTGTPGDCDGGGGTGTPGDCHEVGGGRVVSSTDSSEKQVDTQGGDIGPLATPDPDCDGESSSKTSRRTRSSRRRAQVKLAAAPQGAVLEETKSKAPQGAALEETKSKAVSSQEWKSENSTCNSQRTSSEDLQKTKSETDTPQENKSETKTVGRDRLDSSQEDPSGGRRYSMRQRHASGSSGIVEQLTQSYMARKEQLGSPPTTPTAMNRLRSPLGGRQSLELDLESDPVKGAGVSRGRGRVGGGAGRRSRTNSGRVEPEVLGTDKMEDDGTNVTSPEVRAVREAGRQQPMDTEPTPELKQEAELAKESCSEGLQEAGDSGGLNASCLPPQGPPMEEPAVTRTQRAEESSELVLGGGVVVAEESQGDPGSKVEQGSAVPAEEQKEQSDGPSLTNASSRGDGNGPVVHDGNASAVNDGNGPVVHDGNASAVNDGNGPVVHDGNASAVNDQSGPVVHDGNASVVNDQSGPVVHDGNASVVNDENGAAVNDGNVPVVNDGNGAAVHDGNGSVVHDGNGAAIHDGNGPVVNDGIGVNDGNQTAGDGGGDGQAEGGVSLGSCLGQGGEAEKKLCETGDEPVAMETGGPGGLGVSVEDGCSDGSKPESDAVMRGEEESSQRKEEAGDRVSGGQASPSVSVESSVQPELPVHIPVQAGMTSVQQLQVHNYNLKAALTVEQPSVQRAMVILQDLLEIQCLASDVQQVPGIVKTIRKVRHYRASPKVQGKAEEVYARLKQMFLQPDQPVPPVPSLPRRKMLPIIGVRKRPGNKCGISDIIGTKLSAQELQRLSVPTVPNRQADTPAEGGATGDLEPLRRSARAHSKVDYRGLEKVESGPESESGQDDQTVPG